MSDIITVAEKLYYEANPNTKMVYLHLPMSK
jgi:hypothetical protein